MQPREVALVAPLEYAYSGSAEGGAVVTASVLAAVGPSVSARATCRPGPFAMRGVRGCGESRVSCLDHWPALRSCPRGYVESRRIVAASVRKPQLALRLTGGRIDRSEQMGRPARRFNSSGIVEI